MGEVALAQSDPIPVWLGRGIPADYWVDDRGNGTLAEAMTMFAGDQGKPMQTGQIMPFGVGPAIWFRLRLPPTTSRVPALLTVPYSGMDSVELYHSDGGEHWAMQWSGDRLPVARWPVRYLEPTFAFTVGPGGASAVYVRILHSHPISVSFVLWDQRSFDESSKIRHLLLGFYLGLIALVLLLSVINAVSWRDSIHLYYAVHVVLLSLSVLSLSGVAGEYLWSDSPYWNDIASMVLPAASLGWSGLLARQFVARHGHFVVSRTLLAQAGFGLAISLGFIVFGRTPLFLAFNLFALTSMAFILAVLIQFSMRRPQAGLWFLAGFGVMALSTLLPVLRNLGYLPVNFMTQYGLAIGSFVEIPLVLTGLLLRSRERRDNRMRMDALAATDPLTGAANHRILMERLSHLIKRHQRDPRMGAVIRVRVGNAAVLQAEHGREAAEVALVRATECVAQGAADGDTVARHESGDIVLLIEGRVTRDDVAQFGRDIIARGLKFSPRLPPGVMLALRVAGVCAPLPHGNAEVLLTLLDHVLDDIARHPGRNVRIVAHADSTFNELVASDWTSSSWESLDAGR